MVKKMNTNYRRGYGLEYKVKKMMEKLGYMVLRSPASKSSSDLIAFDKKHKFLIQCKKTGQKDKNLYIYGLSELVELAKKYGAKPLLVYSFYYSPIYAKTVEGDSEILKVDGRHIELEKLLKIGRLNDETDDYIAR
jgi:Holliday junction resolvase